MDRSAPGSETDATYAAEDAAAVGCRRYRTFEELSAHVDEIVCSEWWDLTFPDAPIEVHVERRSRSATFSAARCEPTHGVLWFIDGDHWNVAVVCHELAHLAGFGAHDADFRRALLTFWRRELGFHSAAALQAEFAARNLDV